MGLRFLVQAVNGYLGRKAPKDVLAIDPERAIQAARLEIAPVMHG